MASEKIFSVKWKDGEQPIPLYYIENIKQDTDTLVVYLHGAAGKPLFPYYNGRGISKRVEDASFILFSDPVRGLDPKLETTIGWYCSPHKEEEIITHMVRIVSEARKKYNFKKTMLIGGSAAGIGVVRTSQRMSGVSCFLWNPQTDILKYYAGHVGRWKKAVKYNEGEDSRNTNILDPNLYREDNKYYIAQKVDDHYHINNHFNPLQDSLGENKDNVLLWKGNWDEREGHVAIHGEKQVELLRHFALVSHKQFNKEYFIKHLDVQRLGDQ